MSCSLEFSLLSPYRRGVFVVLVCISVPASIDENWQNDNLKMQWCKWFSHTRTDTKGERFFVDRMSMFLPTSRFWNKTRCTDTLVEECGLFIYRLQK
jgi:hypothetical protein